MVVSRGVVAATAVLAAAACTASAAASPYAESAGVYGNSDMEIGSYGDYTPGEPSRPLAMEPDDTDAPTPAPTPADMPSAVPTMPSDPEEGDLRLVRNSPAVGGAGFVSGALQVFLDGAYGAVCTTNFEDTDADVACRQLGFVGGTSGGEFVLADTELTDQDFIAPIALENLNCTGAEERLVDCPGATETEYSDYVYLYQGSGATIGTCDPVQGTFAFVSCGPATGTEEDPFRPDPAILPRGNAEPNAQPGDVALLTPRLVGGETDTDGAWAYGRLEVFDGDQFVTVSDANFNQELGRRGVLVACRDLGFGTGGQALAGKDSALPDTDGRDNTVGSLLCTGDEASLADCPTNLDSVTSAESALYTYEQTVEENAVALVCYNPSGCESAATEPAQGDIRLVALNGIDTLTQPCDDVHLGGVEFFNDGQWGRICVTGFRTRSTWTVDATVVCRQLGFPFGSIMDNRDIRFQGIGAEDYEDSSLPPTFASIVFCTGTEERLEDCFFPEAFGSAGGDIPGRPDLANTQCSDSDVLAVICRRFPMAESDVIRRL